MEKTYKIIKYLLCATMLGVAVYGIINGEGKLIATGLAGAAAAFAPDLINLIFKVKFPVKLALMFDVFLFFAAFLGSSLRLYDVISFWDLILHGSSGAFLAAVGFGMLEPLAGKSLIRKVNPVYLGVAALTFAMACGTLWEFYEFIMDRFFSYQMQVHTVLPDGSIDTGIIDTMTDELIAFASALLYSISIVVRAKLGKYESLEKLVIRKKNTEENPL